MDAIVASRCFDYGGHFKVRAVVEVFHYGIKEWIKYATWTKIANYEITKLTSLLMSATSMHW